MTNCASWEYLIALPDAHSTIALALSTTQDTAKKRLNHLVSHQLLGRVSWKTYWRVSGTHAFSLDFWKRNCNGTLPQSQSYQKAPRHVAPPPSFLNTSSKERFTLWRCCVLHWKQIAFFIKFHMEFVINVLVQASPKSSFGSYHGGTPSLLKHVTLQMLILRSPTSFTMASSNPWPDPDSILIRPKSLQHSWA